VILFVLEIFRVMDRICQGVPPAATTAARGISLVRVRARTADTDSWTKRGGYYTYAFINLSM
jgi:hypothetical protein